MSPSPPPPPTTAAAPAAVAAPANASPADLEPADYPDRSTYQALPDTPDTPDTPEGSTGIMVAGGEDEDEDDQSYDIEALRSNYKRSTSYPAPGFVRRDITRASTSRGPAPPKPLSPVLSLVGGEVRSERGFAPPSKNSTTAAAATNSAKDPNSTTTTTVKATTTAAAIAAKQLNTSPSSSKHHPAPHRPHHPSAPALPTSKLHHDKAAAASTLPGSADDDKEEEEEEEDEEDSESISEVSSISSASMDEEESWIASFCNVIGHEYFAEVSEEFIEDDFNLTGLGAVVPMYKEALEMILDVDPEEESDSANSASESLSDHNGASGTFRRSRHTRATPDYSMIETSAELLYGLIHQRFITSRQGIQVMYEKYLSNHFGFCPRVNCTSSRVLPCGYSDTPGTETVKLFCPSCCDIYVPPNSRFQSVDGAYFGTTFPTLFLMTFPELDIQGTGKKDVTASSALNSAGGKKGGGNNTLPPVNGVPANNIAPGLGKGKRYEMRIYGFRVNERARSGPRMGWLRDKPEDLGEIDEWAKFRGGDLYESEDEEDNSDQDEGGEDQAMDGGRRRAGVAG